MRIDILTIFPRMFTGPFDESIVKRAVARGVVTIAIHDLRDWTTDRHRSVDDAPFGGGAGMVMKPEPIVHAVEAILGDDTPGDDVRVVLTSASGRRFTQQDAERLAAARRLVFVCGHYEGIDDRVRQLVATDDLSLGDFVLTGGELPAMVMTDAIVRLAPGVIAPESLQHESFANGLLEYPQYTRPAEFRGWRVPDVLLSGNHAAVAQWRRRQAILRTALIRPDLLAAAELSAAECAWLSETLASRDDPPPPDARSSPRS